MEKELFNPLFNFLNLFTSISKDEQELISSHLEFRRVNEGEILLAQGKIARELFFVVDGVLKITSISEKGNDVVLFFLRRNQFCTILRSYTGNTQAAEGIAAACNSELIVISRAAFDKLNKAIPYFKSLLDGIMQQGLLDKIQTRNELTGEDASTRYKKFLVRNPDIALRVPLSDVASYLGITQQSLSRIRRNLK